MDNKFDDHSALYYPTACCEILHASTAVYVCTAVQVVFSVILIFLYFLMEKNGFIEASWLITPIVSCLAFLSAVGNICAFCGVILERASILQCQITILMFMIVLCDIIAVSIIFVMAIGSRTALTAKSPELLVSVKKFESLLGPFWIYLLAIMFHMTAAAMVGIMGVNKRFIVYLADKQSFYGERKQRLEEPKVEVLPTKSV
ncbi:unnamed protein product [Anisakis simplex]|uniref:Uncharacterized protein n=1 Tax=Anisakis simplex TaxID=6269 RepID=A0A0M3JSX6_ANISI|nr:unnamed protein product [Anisakis simplex]